jgi:hypothetical protein
MFVLKQSWTPAQTAEKSEREIKGLFNDAFNRQNLIMLVADK